MKLLQELHNLHEADIPDAVNKIELADLIKHFPNNYKKAVEKLWGGPRLCWHGIPFFGENDTGIVSRLDKAVQKWVKDGGKINIQLSPVKYVDEDGEEYDIEVEYDESVDPTENGQEVYMGYDATNDKLYVGYDGHTDEEVFNDEWDKSFEQATDETFEVDNKSQYKAFKLAHEQYREEENVWFLFEVSLDGDELTVEEAVPAGSGLFYNHNDMSGYDKAQHMGLIDLRLD